MTECELMENQRKRKVLSQFLISEFKNRRLFITDPEREWISPIEGAEWDKREKTWMAYIYPIGWIDYMDTSWYLGYFSTHNEAILQHLTIEILFLKLSDCFKDGRATLLTDRRSNDAYCSQRRQWR